MHYAEKVVKNTFSKSFRMKICFDQYFKFSVQQNQKVIT